MEQDISEVLKSIDTIFQKGHKSKLSVQFQESVQQQSKIVCDYLGIDSDRQAILWSMLVSMFLQKNSSIDLDDFSSYLNTTILRVLMYQLDIENLIKKKVLKKYKSSRRRRNTENVNFLNLYVPQDIIVSLVSGETTLPKRRTQNLNIYDILDVVISLLQEKDDGIIDYEELCNEIGSLLIENKDNPFIKNVLRHKLPQIDLIILMYVSYMFTQGYTSVDLIGLVKTLFGGETSRQLTVRKEWMQGKTRLQELDLVNFESESSFKSEKSILLTKKGRELFGEEQNLFVEQESKSHKDIILSSSIIEKQLFYNDKEQKSIDYLTDLLKPDNYISVVNRMKDLGMKPGFTVLFHGSPGTGKTESVLQLARMTGRDIKKVDLSATKDKWYGSSEKIVRSIFSTYSRENSNSDRQSILLINEADGLLKKRQDGGSEISNLESTVVTILLDSFENFEGIMFCTANNTNFDKSFDRRFLYKILFQPPLPDVLSKIWKNRVPVLTEKQALYLAERFYFSGGQIDNVCKKIVMKQVLTGITPDLLEIEEFCQEESMDKQVGKRRIGYLV